MENGMIMLDSDIASDFGFTSDKFDGYLWRENNDIWISLIISLNPENGNIKQLFDTIEKYKYNLIVPTPSVRMKMICEKRNMVLKQLNSNSEVIECMIK